MGYNFNFSLEAACQIGILPEIYEQYIGYKTDGFFVEIGAFDGYSWSNTLPLIEAGWHGIMVEPDPTNFFMLSQRYSLPINHNLALVNAAICERSGMTILYPGGSISTTVKKMIKVFRDTPGIPMSGMSEDNVAPVVSYCMDDLFEIYGCPAKFDVLSIDTEGGELGVLDGYTIDAHRPKLAIIEYDEGSQHNFVRRIAVGIQSFFKQYGYQKIYYDGMNAIFVDKK